ncbi:hypothetical protein SGPA1_11471 [Streptomyces misionensis JCM 4497]
MSQKRTVPHAARRRCVPDDTGRLGCPHERGCSTGGLGARTRAGRGISLVHACQGTGDRRPEWFCSQSGGRPGPGRRRGRARGLRGTARLAPGRRHARPRRRCHRDLGHTARRLRRLRGPLSRSRAAAARPPRAVATGSGNGLVVAKKGAAWQAPGVQLIAEPRGPG